jgi:hypothetical protein
MPHMVQRSKAATLRPLAASFLALALLAAAGGAQAHSRPHEHGVASIDVAVDGAQLTVLLNMPLDGLLGFERPPRNDRERHAADAALALLRDGARMFGPEAAAQCTLQSVEIDAPVLAPGAKAQGDHAELDATTVFRCAQPAALSRLKLGMFDAFPRLKRVDVQVAGPQGQRKLTLRRPAQDVPLGR